MPVARRSARLRAGTGLNTNKDGGADAADDINQAHLTQVRLTVAADAEVTGQHFYHKQRLAPNPQAEGTNLL